MKISTLQKCWFLHDLNCALAAKIPNKILCQNIGPSSTWFCRNIKLYEKLLLNCNWKKCLDKKLNKSIPAKATVDWKEVHIFHKLTVNMLVEKILNARGETTSQKCSAHATSPKLVNNVALSEIAHCLSNYRFAVLTFLAGIQFSECLLQISYRTEIKNGKWRIKTRRQYMNLSTK